MPYKNPEDKKKHNQKYYKDWYAKHGRERAVDYFEAIREWENNHPDAVEAHYILRNALRKGEIKKPDKCSLCGRKSRLSAHHDDYLKPLDVKWLCSSCHKLIHLEA